MENFGAKTMGWRWLKAQHVVSTWLESFTACCLSTEKTTPNNPVLPPLVITGSPALNLKNQSLNRGCGDNFRILIPFSIFSKYFNHFSWFWWPWIQTTSKFGGFIISPKQLIVDMKVVRFPHKHYIRWTFSRLQAVSTVWPDSRIMRCGGRASTKTWEIVVGWRHEWTLLEAQRSQSIAINTITAIHTIDSTNCAWIYLDSRLT